MNAKNAIFHYIFCARGTRRSCFSRFAFLIFIFYYIIYCYGGNPIEYKFASIFAFFLHLVCVQSSDFSI
jgi:hypothetical protein